MSRSTDRVETGGTSIRGRVEDGVRKFLGIPFAAPPIGRLRFSPPTPPVPSGQPIDATGFGPGPIQPVDGLSRTLGLLGDFEQSEDCLTLNVFAPERSHGDEPLAVMVWLHGGAFQTGTASGPVYDGARLAKSGKVIVVTLNYRVGALGFLATGGPGSANLGLQDQVAALRWIRDEIAAFGGDGTRVTVFGESAGAGSIVALLAMPSAKGLFHRAIIQSAAPDGILSRAEAEARTHVFAEAAGISTASLEAFRALDGQAIRDAQLRCVEPGPRRIGMFFAPFVDGEVLPMAPMEAIAKGVARDVELVIGTTAQEMQLYHLTPDFAQVPEDLLPRVVAGRVGGVEGDERHARAERLLAAYADAALSGIDKFFAIETDASLFVPATRLAEAQAYYQPRTFMYRFDHASPMEGGRLGACHALDIAFALGNIHLVPEFAGEGESARRVSEMMRAAWSRFAREGEPSPPGLDWPAYEATRRATLILDDPCRIADAPGEMRRRAWNEAQKENSA